MFCPVTYARPITEDDVHLELIDRLNWRRALKLRSHPDQLEFIADYEPVALVVLSKCYIQPDGMTWKPFGIITDDTMIGIVALSYSITTCEVLHFLIDRSYQGRGFGKAAMNVIVDHVQQELPRCENLTLTVHPNNECAQGLYYSIGFRPTEEMRDGEIKWQIGFADRLAK